VDLAQLVPGQGALAGNRFFQPPLVEQAAESKIAFQNQLPAAGNYLIDQRGQGCETSLGPLNTANGSLF
jgi:hypothetical protein